jgi:hypothetical protein
MSADRRSVDVGLGFFFWLGGAVHVAHLPGYNFWDGIIWLYYVGRFVAINYGTTP